MANTRPFGFVDFVLLLIVLFLAGAVRAGYLVKYADNARTAGPLLVQDPPAVWPPFAEQTSDPAAQKPDNELESLRRNLKDGGWFGCQAPFAEAPESTAHYSPGYPWLLGLLSRWMDGASLFSTVRWIQCGLGALTAALYFLFALRAFSSRTVALLTGLFCACYPFWVISTAEINDGVLASFVLALCVSLGTRGIQVQGPFTSLLYGLSLAGLALVRAATLPFTFVALAWYLLRSRKESRGWLCALLAFLGFANGLAPWAVRNYQVFHEPIPVVDSAWLHLWLGNNPEATGGPLTEKTWSDSSVPRDEQDFKGSEQPARYAKLGAIVRDEVSKRPARTVQRRVRAWVGFWLGDRLLNDQPVAERPAEADETTVSLPGNTELLLNLSLVGMLFFALLGWRWTYAFRKDAMPSSLALLWIPLSYVLSHAEALHGPRMPLDGILLCYAAFALCCLAPGLSSDLLEGRKPVVDEEP